MTKNPPPSAFHKAGMATFSVEMRIDGEKEIKKPTMPGWRELSSSDLPTRSKNYGIALSEKDLVIDVDVKNGKKGQESWDKMQVLLKRPLTNAVFTVESPSGGRHVWFNLPEGFQVQKNNPNYPDIDFLSEGTFVVGPGTQFKNSKYPNPYKVIQGEFDPEFEFHDINVPPLPEEWYSIVGHFGGQPSKHLEAGTGDYEFRNAPHMIDEFTQYLGRCAPAIENKRGNETTYRVACKGRDKGLTEEKTYELILKHYNPRCKPPWQEGEIEEMVKNAYLYATGQAGKENYLNFLNDLEDEEMPWEQGDSIAYGIETVKTKLKTYTASDIMQQEFPPIRFIVPELMPEGLTLFAGAPKIGKSWMALNLAHAVASGGCVLNEKSTESGRVLYLALEDNSRRIQNRLKAMQVEDAPPNLHFAYEIPRADQDGLTMLEEWLDAFPDCRLVIIDTLQWFRQLSPKDSYASDYEAMTPLHKLAKDRSVSVMLVHHTRKQQADDVFNQISGTQGIFGAVDTAWVLEKKKRNEQDATLHITSRDMQERELVIRLDNDLHRWQVIGEAWEVASSQEEQAALNLFLRQEDFTLTVKELQEGLGITDDNARKRLSRMEKKGLIERIDRGKYKLKVAPALD